MGKKNSKQPLSRFTFSEPLVADGLNLINVAPTALVLQDGDGKVRTVCREIRKKGQEPKIESNSYYAAKNVCVILDKPDPLPIAIVYVRNDSDNCQNRIKLGFPVKAEELPKGYEKAVRHFVTENF